MKTVLFFLLLSGLSAAPSYAQTVEPAAAAAPTKNNYIKLLTNEGVQLDGILECAEHDFGHPGAECRAEDNLIQGLIALLIAQDSRTAQDKLNAYVTVNPDKPLAYHYLGRAAANMQDYAAAENYFLQAQKLNYTDKENYYQLGHVYHAQGKCTRAIDSFAQALALNYHDPVIFSQLGDCEAHQQNFPVALDYFNQALSAQPEQHQLLRKRAAIHFHLKNYESALADITAAAHKVSDTRYALLERYYTRKKFIYDYRNVIIMLFVLCIAALIYRLRTLTAAKQLLDYRGNIDKVPFAFNYATVLALKLFCALLLEVYTEAPMLYLIAVTDLVLLYIILATVAKRLRALNIDVRFALLALIPVVNIIQFVYLIRAHKRPEIN